MNELQAAICVVGAGPAGSLLAGLLASAGRDVLLVGPHQSSAVTPLQSLTSSGMVLLQDEGVDISGSWLDTPISVRWPGGRESPVPKDDQTTSLVDRETFDAALRAWAVLRGVRTLRARLSQPPHFGAGVASLTIDDRSTKIRTGQVINAAGAHSVFAPRRVSIRPPLFGLASTPVISRDVAGVWVEATKSGWLWAASVGDGRLSLLTAHDVAPPRRDALSTSFCLVGQSSLAPMIVESQKASDELRPVDLTPTFATHRSEVLAVGDAALTIDPLAGQGLSVALRSAAQTADLLLNGTPLVKTVAEVSHAHAEFAAEYYRLGSDHFDTPFWKKLSSPMAGLSSG